MLRIFVTDPEQRAALATVRSLGARGWQVETIGASRGLAGRSRFVRRHHHVPAEAVRHPEAYREAVVRAVQAGGDELQPLSAPPVVVPVTDAASRMLLGYDDLLGATIAGPTAEAYRRASDKAGLLEAAAAIGMRVPKQQQLNAPPLTDAIPGTPYSIPVPLVVKPSRSVVQVNGRAVSLSVRFVDDLASLPTTIAAYPAEAFPLLLQERVVGDGVGVFLLRSSGRTLLSFGHRRLREKPPAGGVSTYREAVVPPAGLLTACEQLLDALDYSGAAMVEFKEDAITGEPVLMEINARLWGSVQLAVDAGADFPAALVEWAVGRTPPAPTTLRAGVRTVWELGELDHALALLRSSAAALHLPAGTPTGPVAAWNVLRDHRPNDYREVLRWHDPMPFVSEVLRWVARK
jgi:predicted ATP-grasp superfamily ATP-dependent carboligase